MTSTALTIRERTEAIAAVLDDRREALQAFLPTPRHVERFRRVILQSLAKNPDLLAADGSSIVSAAFEAARLGLEPSGAIGGAHLVRYGQTVQLIVDYRGLVELARRSDEILSIAARVVREGEEFHVHYGSHAGIEHEFDMAASTADPSNIVAVYAIAKLRGGGEQFDVMTKDEIEAIRAKSRAGNNGPWRTDWAEMAKKTVLRRLCKLLPLTVEAREALDREDEVERAAAPVSEPPSGLRDVIAQRTAALEQAVPEEPEPNGEPQYEGEVLDIDDIPFEHAQPTLTRETLRGESSSAGQSTGRQEVAGTPSPPGSPPAEPTLDDILAATGGTLEQPGVTSAGDGGGPVPPQAPPSTPARSPAQAEARAARERLRR